MENSMVFGLLLLLNYLYWAPTTVNGGGVFEVNSKFSGVNRSLEALKAHDSIRHLQILAGVDLPIGGTGRPDAVGLYYAKVAIGTPAKDYYVQVDTGSDIMWVNCINCQQCPVRGYRGLELTQYNVKASITGKLVSCEQEFCKEIMRGLPSDCSANETCLYTEVYGDGSFSMGYFVEDFVQYDRVSGDLQTEAANGSVIFGCGAGPSADLGSADDALDGVLGFGKENSSMISQLASTGRVKNMFAHCLDGVNGGGIFAIGHVVQPKVNMTALVPDQPHYSVNMTGIEVGHTMLNGSQELFMHGNNTGAIIDSGTTLAYFPEDIYKTLVLTILSSQSNLRLLPVHDDYTCFEYSESVDKGFPPVTFHFGSSLSLKVYPRDYLFPFDGLMCVGWQSSKLLSADKRNITLLGDLVLSNKLVLYDLENQTIGWTEYNCSSSIELKDELTGSVHLVGAHSVTSTSSSCRSCRQAQKSFIFLLLMTLLHGLLLGLWMPQ